MHIVPRGYYLIYRGNEAHKNRLVFIFSWPRLVPEYLALQQTTQIITHISLKFPATFCLADVL